MLTFHRIIEELTIGVNYFDGITWRAEVLEFKDLLLLKITRASLMGVWAFQTSLNQSFFLSFKLLSLFFQDMIDSLGII